MTETQQIEYSAVQDELADELAPTQVDSTAVAAARAIEEIRAKMVIAKKFPRDTEVVRKRIAAMCSRRRFAEASQYSYPRGNETVNGLSIRAAEGLAQAYGNLSFGVEVLAVEPGREGGASKVRVFCWDLEEAGTDASRIFPVKHYRETKKGGYALTDERDIYEQVANQSARRLRAAILQIIPTDIQDEAQDLCDATMRKESEKEGKLAERITRMLAGFKDKYKVTKEQIEQRLHHKAEAMTHLEFVQLGKIWNSLEDGAGKASDYFEGEAHQAPAPQPAAQANGNAQPASQPPPQAAVASAPATVDNKVDAQAKEAAVVSTSAQQSQMDDGGMPSAVAKPAPAVQPGYQDLLKEIEEAGDADRVAAVLELAKTHLSNAQVKQLQRVGAARLRKFM